MIRQSAMIRTGIAAVLAMSLLAVTPGRIFVHATAAAAASAPEPSASNPGPGKLIHGPFAGKLPISELNEQEAILHALNRLGYGPRPGDVERIQKIGLENWIQAQLHPEDIKDSVVDARLAEYPALGFTSEELLEKYPPYDVAAKRLGVSVEELLKRLKLASKQSQRTNSMPFGDQNEVVDDLMTARIIRAAYSERQLAERLDGFWFNHFNIFIYKDLERWYAIPYDRDAIRPNVLGKFRDLLEATAKSPAMLFYLDNSSSADPNAFSRLKHRPAPSQSGVKLPSIGSRRGLNENYARELMELHTLGVDGGYSQQDVIDVARAFTGWTIASPREHPAFYFDERIHDPDLKRVLGKKIKAGGIKDAEQVLDLLVKNPHAAHFISLQLAQHFVSDIPPETLVARMAKTFKKSKGDIRAVMTSMIYSPEFWSRAAMEAKIKTPFDLVLSASRAAGADVDQPMQLAQWIGRIGEPLYQCLTPNGYSDKASAWVSTGALLNRMNFAVALTSNRIRGVQVDLASLVGEEVSANAHLAMERVEAVFLSGQVSDSTRAILENEISDPQILRATLDDPVRQVNLGLISGLVLGSPEFQKR
jgi:uncharacterized protein (DUF1800 family)